MSDLPPLPGAKPVPTFAGGSGRLTDWETRLGDYLARHRGAVFAWGRLDCVLFAAGAVEALTGEDPAAAVRKRYRTKIGAARKLRQQGFRTIAALMDSRFEPVQPAFAQRGDIVMAQGSLGVCVGRQALFIGEEDGAPGLVSVPLAAWERAWRVPFAAAGG
jgi:hypothetical protein